MRRPWNIIDVPVYSLATYGENGVNMNICTYVSVISMKPKQYLIGIDPATKTMSNLNVESNSVLQLMHKNQASLIKPLGKKSGFNFDKYEWLQKNDLLATWNGKPVLKNCSAYLLLEKIKQFNVQGDHELFCFNVEKSRTVNDTGILTFQKLIDDGIIL